MTRALEIEHRFTSGVYPKRDVALVRGEGATVWDADGREFVDCASGHGVANVGHAHPVVTAAVQAQAARLVTCPETFYNDARAAFLENLVEVLPAGLERLFLCNSGTEAVEAALKFARLTTGRSGVVATLRGFHGRTLGALSANGTARSRAAFEPLLPGFRHVPFARAEAMEEAIDDETSCVIVEIVQGEGGVHIATTDYFQRLRELCDERGALLVVDEVQTGFGRTGRWFASEHHGLAPDLLCLGKAIAGGLPMGAVACGSRVGELAPGAHGSTFGGNPLACAAGLSVLEVLREERLPERAAELGGEVVARLCAANLPVVREVRGLGLMIGVDLRTRVTPILKELLARGVLALPAGPTVLRLLPPLNIGREQLFGAVETSIEVLANAKVGTR